MVAVDTTTGDSPAIARAIAGTPERFVAAPAQEVLTLLRKRFEGQTGALEVAIFNFLAQSSTKVPQTEPGMNGFKAGLITVMQQFVTNGELAPGAWNSSETFGDPQIFNQNIAQNGYYVYSQPVALQSAAARNARQAPLVQIAAKRAGAIQSANIIVVLNA